MDHRSGRRARAGDGVMSATGSSCADRSASDPTGRPLLTDVLGELVATRRRRAHGTDRGRRRARPSPPSTWWPRSGSPPAAGPVLGDRRAGARGRRGLAGARARAAGRLVPAGRRGLDQPRQLRPAARRPRHAARRGDRRVPAWYRDRGLTPRITVPLPLRRDVADALADRGLARPARSYSCRPRPARRPDRSRRRRRRGRAVDLQRRAVGRVPRIVARPQGEPARRPRTTCSPRPRRGPLRRGTRRGRRPARHGPRRGRSSSGCTSAWSRSSRPPAGGGWPGGSRRALAGWAADAARPGRCCRSRRHNDAGGRPVRAAGLHHPPPLHHLPCR